MFMGMSKRRERTFIAIVAAFVCFMVLVGLEVGLRAYKSIAYDGMLHISTSSVNNVTHERFGWISPPNRVVQEHDACYGKGMVSYHEDGFRAPPRSEATGADSVVCILGDSTMQGYQLADGSHVPHLLAKAYRDRGKRPPAPSDSLPIGASQATTK